MNDSPDRIILACEVFRNELDWLAARMDNPPPIHYLEMGLHQRPDQLKKTVQDFVDKVEQQYHQGLNILFAYGLCGQGLSGITAKTATIILPRVHDCIPLLLGIDQDDAGIYSQNGTTYWQSPGWVNYAESELLRNKDRFFEEYKEKFGEDNARYLMDEQLTWLNNYTAVSLIRWPELDEMEKELAKPKGFFETEARCFAKEANLPFSQTTGSDNYLRALLAGGTDQQRFLHIRPGYSVILTADGILEAVYSN